jgi:hypothetical protein
MSRLQKFVTIIGVLGSLLAPAAIILGLSQKASTAVSVHEPLPYLGKWSNGRGETLAITSKTIQFASDKPVTYRDVTKATNGQEFNLEVTSEGKLNYLTKYLHVSTGEGEKPEEMKMTLYNSRKDMEDGENSQGEATWYRDE